MKIVLLNDEKLSKIIFREQLIFKVIFIEKFFKFYFGDFYIASKNKIFS